MKRTFSLAWIVIVIGIWVAIPGSFRAALANTQGSYKGVIRATPPLSNLPKRDRLVAQLFYPAVSDRQGVMVQGHGEATAPADTARIDFSFTSSANLFEQVAGASKPSSAQPPTKATLQPVVDALIASGVPASAIEVNTSPTSSSALSFPFPFPLSKGSAQVVVKIEQPTRDRIQQIVTVVGNQKNLSGNLSMQNVSVEYAINDCQPLVRTAYAVAVKDAQNRAVALAEAMGVKIAQTPSVAESSIPNFFGTSAVCSSKVDIPLFPFAQKQPYDPSAPAQVQVKKDIFATYAVR